MLKYYLVSEKGLTKEKAFPIDGRVTIGRRADNDIQVMDSSVSRLHAKVYLMEGQAIVEDLTSQNGTFVNGKRVKKAVLSSGDILRLGGVDLQFVQKEEPEDKIDLLDTQELIDLAVCEGVDGEGQFPQSTRIIEAISRVPCFSSLGEESLYQVSHSAQLVVGNRGTTIIRHRDRDTSFYIILDGKVRVSSYDYQGKEVHLATLSENEFFGEISLLTGAPLTVKVQAVEETLLYKLSFEAMQDIFKRFPFIKTKLQQYCQDRLEQAEAKKTTAGRVERRRALLRKTIRM